MSWKLCSSEEAWDRQGENLDRASQSNGQEKKYYRWVQHWRLEPKPRRSRTPSQNNRSRSLVAPHRSRAPLWRFYYFTPLDTSRAQILIEIERQEDLPLPKKMLISARARNPRKYCRYHKDHEHDTKKCSQLMEEIEALIQYGCLRRYVDERWISRNKCNKPPR